MAETVCTFIDYAHLLEMVSRLHKNLRNKFVLCGGCFSLKGEKNTDRQTDGV